MTAASLLRRAVPVFLCLVLAGCSLAKWVGVSDEVTLLQLEQRYETLQIRKSRAPANATDGSAAVGESEDVYAPSTMASIAEEAARLAADARDWRTASRAWHLSARAWIGAGERGEVNVKAAADKVTGACGRADSAPARGNAICQTAPILPHIASMNEQARGIRRILVAVNAQRQSREGMADARFADETRHHTDILRETDYPAIRRLGETAFAATGNVGLRRLTLRNLHRITCNVGVAVSFLGVVETGEALERTLFDWNRARRAELDDARAELEKIHAQALTFDPC